jgi:hypothetical protein
MEVMRATDSNPLLKRESCLLPRQNPKETGEIAIVHCSIVICHLWKESFFLK